MALAVVCSMGLFSVAFEPWLDGSLPLLSFTVAVLVSGLFAGLGPGVFATGLSLAAMAGLFSAPDKLHPGSPLLPHLGLLLLVSAIVLWATQAKRSEAARAALEERELRLQTGDLAQRNLDLAELQRAREEAEASRLAKDRFLAVLSHELRTPLMPVLMIAEALESHPDMPEHLRSDATLIRRHVSLESRLIDDLLDLTRIETGKLHLKRQTVDLNPVLQAAVEKIRAEAKGKGIAITTTVRLGRACIHADRARIEQVIWNLLGNALKFTPPGGAIALLAENIGNCVRVTVSDSGIGLAPEAIGTIFDAFEQADATHRRFGGLGLGLAIAKSLVTLHGGQIQASSQGLGHGATFIVTLPSTEQPPLGIPPLFSGSGTSRLRILLVEDHEPTAFVLARLLKRKGHDVRLAVTMSEALSFDQDPIDLMVSDIGLPDGSGIDIVRHFRAVQSGFNAIALSGFGMESDIEQSLTAGFDRHLTKPVDFETLQQAIAELLEEKAKAKPRPALCLAHG